MKPDQTVYIVDDDQTVLEGVRELLESVKLPAVVFPNATQFLASFDPDQSGCLVADIRLPGMSGLELQEHLLAQSVLLPIIFITAYGEVSSAVRAMKNGALDFLQKPYSVQDLLDGIQRALALDQRNRLNKAHQNELRDRLSRLTAREREVLDRVTGGMANKAVASELGISVKTVEAFRAKIMEKMKANSLAELVRQVLIAHGEISPQPRSGS